MYATVYTGKSLSIYQYLDRPLRPSLALGLTWAFLASPTRTQTKR